MKQIKKDLQEIKNEVDEEKEQIGLATEIIKSKTEQLKRKDFIIILLIVCWFITGCYLVYLLNDIGEICEWESPLTTVWMPKGAYRLVGGVSSNANIVIFAYSCNV